MGKNKWVTGVITPISGVQYLHFWVLFGEPDLPLLGLGKESPSALSSNRGMLLNWSCLDEKQHWPTGEVEHRCFPSESFSMGQWKANGWHWASNRHLFICRIQGTCRKHLFFPQTDGSLGLMKDQDYAALMFAYMDLHSWEIRTVKYEASPKVHLPHLRMYVYFDCFRLFLLLFWCY